MFTALFQVLSAGISLWLDKEKNKYINKLNQLQKDYYAASNKPADQIDDALLDNLEFELKITAQAWASQVAGGTNK